MKNEIHAAKVDTSTVVVLGHMSTFEEKKNIRKRQKQTQTGTDTLTITFRFVLHPETNTIRLNREDKYITEKM